MADFPSPVITLPSGRVARVLRKIKVRDTVLARRVVGVADADNPNAISLATLAATIELDGKPALYEDLLDLDIDDLVALGNAAGIEPEKKASPAPLN